MPEKRKEEKRTRRRRVVVQRERRVDIVKLCSFWGIAFAALVMFIGFIISLLKLLDVSIGAFNTIYGIFNMISMIALLIAVAFPAYGYVRGKGRNWRILYWVVLIMYICGLIGIGFIL